MQTGDLWGQAESLIPKKKIEDYYDIVTWLRAYLIPARKYETFVDFEKSMRYYRKVEKELKKRGL